ncbi:NAD(P)H-dependent oxidoreductase [Mycobacterium sp. ACS4331]|uniref:flavodoxin family protein n=1 Tax=Mycobacterium sp. ACS4331 TaxID=1834121 RepID=UPI0008011C16|nr:NAD(P)H-dependent oxidoreductase [Mycobacterium sp. ACS4331]OBF17551.1 flavodoxin [Mycobacterium sp. ACS4331]
MPVNSPPLRAVALVCTLKPGPDASSSQLIAEHVFETLETRNVACQTIRCVDYTISPGVETDMGGDDQWPQIRSQVLESDILVLSTPVWLGHPSSVAQRVLERLDAELSNADDEGRPALAGKVAIVSVVGNEDGAHKVVADVFQALNDVGYSIPAQGCTYWNGPAMESTDYRELEQVPESVASATAAAARNAAHLARQLKSAPYPPYR